MSDSIVYRAAVQIEVEVGRGTFSGAALPQTKSTQPPSRDVIEHLIADYLVGLYGEQVKMKVECSSFVSQQPASTPD